MKKHFLIFAMLISVAANATVTVTPISTDYTTKNVTFKVAWTNSPTAPYNNRVWVWVDFCPVTGTTPATSFSTATISNPTKTGGNGTITNITTRGFFVEYSAANAGTTVTTTLSNAPAGKFNWCVYGSDYPPNVTAAGGIYTLHGSPPFTLTAANGTTTQTVAATSIATSAVTITPVTLTDQTGCPGVFCIYTGSDLYIDGTHLCQQRTDGAKNWEAWIEDPRDHELYRIVQYSNGVWWWAEDYRGTNGYERTCNGVALYSATDKNSDCPTDWRLPELAEVVARFNVPPTADEYGGALIPRNTYWGYGTTACRSNVPRCDIIVADLTTAALAICSTGVTNTADRTPGQVRCVRQL